MGEASAAKVFGTELTQQVARELLDVLGHDGLRRGADAPLRGELESAYRFAVINTFGGGANELQRDIIAMAGLGHAAGTPRPAGHRIESGGTLSDRHTKTILRQRLDALVGKPTGGAGKPSVAPDPVNQPMIRHWAHALDDMNPAYLDPEFAAASRYGGIVSPPVMLQTWTMPSPKLEGIGERGGAPIEIKKQPTAVPRRRRIHRHRRHQLGVRDRALSAARRRHQRETVYEIDLRREEDGDGHRLLRHLVTTYRDQHGEVLGRQRFRMLRFRPAKLMATRLAPSISPDTEFFWNGLSEHKLLIQRCTRLRDAAHPAAPDVPQLPVPGLGCRRVVGPRHGLQLRDAAVSAVAVLRVPLRRRARRARRGVRIVSNLCDIEPADIDGRACRSRSSTRPSTVLIRDDLVLHQFRPSDRGKATPMDFTFTEEQETVGKVARQLFEHRATPGTSDRTGSRRSRATTPRCGANSPPSICSASRCPSRSAAAAAASWNSACCSPRSGGASPRCPSTRRWFWAPTPIARHGIPDQQQRYLPGVVDGSPILTAGLAEPGTPTRPQPRTTARRDGATWRLDGTKELVPAAQLADAMRGPGHHRRR